MLLYLWLLLDICFLYVFGLLVYTFLTSQKK
jgi:hypothetical protein